MIEAFKKILSILNRSEKQLLILISLLILSLGFIETIGIAILIPFIDFLIKTNNQFQVDLGKYLEKFDIEFLKNFYQIDISTLSVIIIIFYIFKNIYIIYSKYFIFLFSNKIQVRISKVLFESFINRNLDYYQNNNSSKIINLLQSQTREFKKVLSEVINIYIEIIIILCILALLIYINKELVIYFSVILFILVIINIFLFKSMTIQLGEKKNKTRIKSLSLLRDYFQSIKEILIETNKNFFVSNYIKSWNKFLRTQLNIAVLRNLPRSIVEIITVISIMILINYKQPDTNTQDLLVQLSIYLIALVRIFPSLSKIGNSVSIVRFNVNAYENIQESINETKNELDKKISNEIKNLKNFNKLNFENISFAYSSKNSIFEKKSFVFKKGQLILIKGHSGTGKTTLLNLLMGLLTPAQGRICLDNKDIGEIKLSYHNIISYVPQEISILDDSFLNNILFSRKSEFNQERFEQAINKSGLKSFINNLVDGVNTRVGEFGSKISGGQKQRICIARALYKDAKILFFDEFTSSLDYENEKEIMNSIINLKQGRIIFIVSHNDSFDKYADQIIDMNSLN